MSWVSFVTVIDREQGYSRDVNKERCDGNKAGN